ncbi:MAG: hypothetical protein IJS82_04250 [Paludibacteraceae bacterium]|nr:hypothetical protein [Paludibacteraceae bacterium]
MKKLSLRTFIQNLYSLWVYDFHSWDTSLSGKIDYIEKNIAKKEKWDRIVSLLENYKGELSDSREMAFVRALQIPQFVVFPYHQIKRLETFEVGYDNVLKLLYVIHDKKRLYYNRAFTIDSCERSYRFLIEQDQILEGGYLEKAPHCYQTESFKVEEGDVLIDGGAAEGLFALDVIDKVSHVYLIEADSNWIPALKATFAPYKDKVTIINKYLSDCDDTDNISLGSILARHNGNCFVKMDIEGAEPKVIKGALSYLNTRDNVKLSCCTYHYQNDAKELADLFESIGYQHEFSAGWFFFAEYDMPEPPYLRHALIRAKNESFFF